MRRDNPNLDNCVLGPFGVNAPALQRGYCLFDDVDNIMYPFKGGLEVKFTRKTRGLGFKIMRVRIKGKAG